MTTATLAPGFKELTDQLSQTVRDSKKMILETLRLNGGRITLPPLDDEQDTYPVTATFNGPDYDLRLNITSVYEENGDLFADGIDSETGDLEKDYEVFQNHYSDIIDFLEEAVSMINDRAMPENPEPDSTNS